MGWTLSTGLIGLAGQQTIDEDKEPDSGFGFWTMKNWIPDDEDPIDKDLNDRDPNEENQNDSQKEVETLAMANYYLNNMV